MLAVTGEEPLSTSLCAGSADALIVARGWRWISTTDSCYRSSSPRLRRWDYVGPILIMSNEVAASQLRR